LRIAQSLVSFMPVWNILKNVIAEILLLLEQDQPHRRTAVTHALETAPSPVVAATD
jgi:hypothetical protein